MNAPDTVNILGVNVSAVTVDAVIRTAVERATARTPTTIMYANIHVLNSAHRNTDLRGILNRADMVYCDGEGVRLGAWLLGRQLPSRMTGADWIDPLCAACVAGGVTLFLLGGDNGVAGRAAGILRDRYRGLKIAGVHSGYLSDPTADSGAVSAIAEAKPNILLVGMGTPAQELWIDRHRPALDTPVVWAVGALFDFVAGVQPRGPRWMLDHGMEWLYRLWSNPRRLWKRYLAGIPLFVWRVTGQRISGGHGGNRP